MQFRNGTFFADGYHTSQTEVWKYAYGNDYGHDPNGKYHAVRNVPVDGKPYSSISYGSSYGSAHTDAVCSSNHSSMGSRRASKNNGTACINKQCKMYVYMGRTDFCCQSQR